MTEWIASNDWIAAAVLIAVWIFAFTRAIQALDSFPGGQEDGEGTDRESAPPAAP